MPHLPTDDLLSPASKLLSPVTRLDKAHEIMQKEQKKRMAALSNERIRRAMAQLDSRRSSRQLNSTDVGERAVPSQSQMEEMPRRANVSIPEKKSRPLHRRPVQRSDESDEAFAKRVKAAELERSYELLRRLEEDDKKARLRVQAEKEKLVPTSNYHLKHLGYGDDNINIYAPFRGPSEESSKQNSRPQALAPEQDQKRQATASVRMRRPSESNERAHIDVPRVIRRKAKPSPASASTSPGSKRTQRNTPLKARLRPRNSSVHGNWMIHALIALIFVLVIPVTIYALTHEQARLSAVKAHLVSVLQSSFQWTLVQLHNRNALVLGIILTLCLLRYWYNLSASDERMIERLVVCAKEELLLHATSNLPGHTAIPENYLREAVLDLLGYKSNVRKQAGSLWPNVRTILGHDSRIKCYRSKSKPGVYLWEWIAPQSEVAMNRYAAAVTVHRNENL
ncbi:unnamed protein product [Aphanomyces euteiches]